MLMDPRPSLCDLFPPGFHLKEEAVRKQGFSLALEAQETSQLLNILLVLGKVCRTESLHSCCCQELDTHEERRAGTKHPGALLMENISSALGSANGDLDPGRNTVIFNTCGDKEQDFSQHGLSPTLLWPLWTSVHLSLRCTRGVHGKKWEGSMGHGYNPRKTDSETRDLHAGGWPGNALQNHTCEEVKKAG